MEKKVLVGTIRVGKDLQTYQKTKTSWKKIKREFPELLHVVELFKANKNFKVLVDTKDKHFLKGQLSSEGLPQGARLNVLPDGTVIDKAYSLFAEKLVIHDQDSHDHWDVLYHNKGGTWSYCYSKKKKELHTKKKYQRVANFAKVYDRLFKKVSLALKNKKDKLALPMYTLLMTKMRIGNEIYYRLHKHKGLTTLKKKDVQIKGNKVIFNYIGKDGVPNRIEKEFPTIYCQRLNEKLKKLKRENFIFTSTNNKPLQEKHFKQAFKRYCGKEFYPHIVRSYYATSQVKQFLDKKKKISKKEMKEFMTHVASELGHKRFAKKDNEWKESFAVTLNSYVQPSLVERLKRISQ